MRRSPAVVDRKAIAEHAWADETEPLGSNAIDVQMSRLRAKLPERRHPDRHGPRRRLPAGGGVTTRGPRARPLPSVRQSRSASPSRRPAVVAVVYLAVSIAVVVIVQREPDRPDRPADHRVVRPAPARRRRPAPAARTTRRRRTGSAARRSSCWRSSPTARVLTDDARTRPCRPSTRRRRARRRRRSTASTSGSPAGQVGDDWVVVGQSLEPVSETRSTVILAELADRADPPRRGVPRRGRDRPAGRGADRGGAPAPARLHRRRVARAADAARGHRGPHEPRPRPGARRRLVPGRVRAGRPTSRSGCGGCSRTSSGWPGSTPRSGRRTPSRSTSRCMAGQAVDRFGPVAETRHLTIDVARARPTAP